MPLNYEAGLWSTQAWPPSLLGVFEAPNEKRSLDSAFQGPLFVFSVQLYRRLERMWGLTAQPLRHQLPVGQVSGVHDAPESVREDVRIIAVIVTPLQFFQVAIQMLDAHLVERADDRPLEQTPHALNRVGVNLADNPLVLRVLDRLMAGIVILDPDVGFQLIGVDGFGLVPDVALDEAVQGVAADVGDALYPDLPAALDGTGHPGLAFFAPRADVAALATDQRFVHFDDTDQRRSLKRVVTHRFSNPVAQVPGRSVGGADGTHELIGRDSFLGLAHEVDCQEPLSQGQVGIVHDGSRGHGELVAATPALPAVVALKLIHVHISATEASNPVGPAGGFQCFAALCIIVKTIHQ